MSPRTRARSAAPWGRRGGARVAILEVLVDDPRLGNGHGSVVEQRYLVVRVQCQELGLELVAREQVDVHHLVV
jgi:hypothetical protein